VKSPIDFIAWQILKKIKHSKPMEELDFEVCIFHYYN